VTGLRDVTADVVRLPRLGLLEHTDRLIYAVEPTGGALRAEVDGTTDRVAWAGPAELAGWPLLPFTAKVLGRRAPDPDGAPEAVGPPAADPPADPAPPARMQRFGVYGLVTDPAGRILLTRIARGYPGAGRWHLPGGGTDHGELPEAGLARELVEETAQRGRIVELLGASQYHDPAAVGPEGVPIDWHVVRVLFRVLVDRPTEPLVTEAAGGSTSATRWVTAAEAAGLELTGIAAAALRRLAVDVAHR
jgi:ADP-ribose pyrophosphatase YjhB (NUDIX family)